TPIRRRVLEIVWGQHQPIGAYAGGLDVRDPAIAGLFGRRTRIHILGQSRLHSFLAGQLAYLS
ncbi:MAG TPA: hypothetical protein VIE35_18060, partial [Dongiaceae bacterium]